ncbi:MAG: penicillin acylase family protein [Bacteroidetes bacterium]|nr:penicillin acylase family protein [Bacteroidota bacterium]
MKRIYAVALLLLCVFLIYIFDTGNFNIPPLGKMLSPTHGVWKNAESSKGLNVEHLNISTPDGPVDVYYDERGIPHLFAENEASLYYAQGFVQAKDRLWQMDFQVRVAEGRLSEIIGSEGLEVDRFFRRIGIPKSGGETIDAMSSDPLYNTVVQAYTNGINAYINQLRPTQFPLEYKLANYSPEAWTSEKSVLLLKLMALRLSGTDTDVANTNTLKMIGRDAFDLLFPDFPKDQSPIIPSGTPWKFKPVEMSSPVNLTQEAYALLPSPIRHQKGIGSNNWAVGKNKTADGGSILCNDPHLGLSFPSIWYEMQLNAPGINVYGVTIPGSPCIIIGFNESIAWGVTNGSRDVRDWYSVQYKDDSQQEYLLDSTWHMVQERVEVIKVRNAETFIDTVKWTKVGPVVYDESFGSILSNKGLAVQWLALEVSNELSAFYALNKANDHDDYLNALKHYKNPAQNFAFADTKGNVAIKEQGKFKVRDENRGKFIEPLNDQNDERLYTFIPDTHNPHVLNPPRGYVSSANQHPADSTYPYNFGGWYETFRNRRINGLLDSLDDLTVDDMKILQNDNYNLMAEEMLPFLLSGLNTSDLPSGGKAIVDSLNNWNYVNEHYKCAPAYFQDWWIHLKDLLWDEMSDSTMNLRIPYDYYTFRFLVDHPDHDLIDNKNTEVTEDVELLINESFASMAVNFNTKYADKSSWQYYNAASIQHLMQLDAFGRFELPIGGSENSINANLGNHGPSWRMIVRLNEEGVKGYAVYPGGQSGNPGDAGYDDFVDEWYSGEYFDLNFFKNKAAAAAYIAE